MATSYKTILDVAYDKIKEYDFVKMTEDESDDILKSYIRPACIDYFYKRGKTLVRDDVVEQFEEDLGDIDIVVLATYLVIRYIDANYINTTLMLKSHLSGTDFHAYTNKDMLAKVKEVRDSFKQEIDQLTVNYSYTDKNCALWGLNDPARPHRYGNSDNSNKGRCCRR